MKSVQGVYDQNDQLLLLSSLTSNSPMMGAIYLFGSVTGLRISDILRIKTAEFAKKMKITASKSKKTSAIVLGGRIWEFMEAYHQLRLNDPDPRLFPTTRQTVHRHFRQSAKDLGIPSFGPHGMRRTYAWNVLRTTGCLPCVQNALQHKYMSTTMIYLVGGALWAAQAVYGAKEPILKPTLGGNCQCSKT